MIKAHIIHNAIGIKYLENDKSIELLLLLSISWSFRHVLYIHFSFKIFSFKGLVNYSLLRAICIHMSDVIQNYI